jgi:hypothetical protein
VLRPGEYTYTLEESTAALLLWTTPCTRKVRLGDRPPDVRRSGLHLSAARNEFEPAQLVIGPGGGSATVTVDPFPTLPGARIETAVAGFVDGWSETLAPLPAGGTVRLSGDHGVPVWITVHVPRTATAGTHETVVRVGQGGSTATVPLRLDVFDFALPDEIHFATQLNLSVGDLVPDGGTVDDAKTLLFEHRMTPASVAWPSGYHWRITWENERSDAPCERFWDEPDEPEAYSIGRLGPRYVLGEGWNGVGFPDSMLFQFVDNATPRPGTFCGVPRGDHHGTAAYNEAWSRFLAALDGYLVDRAMQDRTYYYVQNEPQDDADHRLAAHLCALTRAAAPHLRIAISEEPKPEIAEDPANPCGYDVWIAHVRHYAEGYAWARQRDHGEQVWLYSLDHDPDPYFNPTRVDRQGMHARIIPWVSWGRRAVGWAYYDFGRFFHDGRPGVRAELFREGFEDYEYLWLANGGAHPRVFETRPVDATVESAASGLTSWTQDPDALMVLRRELGRYIEGSRATLPILEIESVRPRGEYHLNFQDPAGRPLDEPLVVNGDTCLKIGWEAYDEERGWGWSGEHVGNPGILMYGYDATSGYDERQRSYLYDDYGRDNLFEFALGNGRYAITVGAGRPARAYPNDPHHVAIEGIPVIDDEPTTAGSPTFERTTTVDLRDGSLSVVTGGRSETTGEWSYTFLQYLDVVPVE